MSLSECTLSISETTFGGRNKTSQMCFDLRKYCSKQQTIQDQLKIAQMHETISQSELTVLEDELSAVDNKARLMNRIIELNTI